MFGPPIARATYQVPTLSFASGRVALGSEPVHTLPAVSATDVTGAGSAIRSSRRKSPATFDCGNSRLQLVPAGQIADALCTRAGSSARSSNSMRPHAVTSTSEAILRRTQRLYALAAKRGGIATRELGKADRL